MDFGQSFFKALSGANMVKNPFADMIERQRTWLHFCGYFDIKLNFGVPVKG